MFPPHHPRGQTSPSSSSPSWQLGGQLHQQPSAASTSSSSALPPSYHQQHLHHHYQQQQHELQYQNQYYQQYFQQCYHQQQATAPAAPGFFSHHPPPSLSNVPIPTASAASAGPFIPSNRQDIHHGGFHAPSLGLSSQSQARHNLPNSFPQQLNSNHGNNACRGGREKRGVDSSSSRVELHCSPCEKVFTSQNAYTAHIATHDKCSVCSFEGTKKVVAAHFQSSHGAYSGNGYKQIEVEGRNFKVLMGTDPDEVAEWRDQRRKKFPTKRLVAEKRAHEEEARLAGGLVGRKRSSEIDNKDSQPEEKHRKQSLSEKTAAENSPVSFCESHVVSEPSSVDEKEAGSPRPVCKVYRRRGKCRYGKKCHFAHDSVENGKGGRANRSLLERSLFGKLVESEVKQEDNIILQCFRYLVSSNFMGLS